MNLNHLIKLAQDYEQDVIYSPFNTYVHFGCSCCGGDSYTEDSWGTAGEAHDRAEQAWIEACNSLGIYNKMVQGNLYYNLIGYDYCCIELDTEDDFDVEAIWDYLNFRKELEGVLCEKH